MKDGVKVGAKLKFAKEKQRFTVMAHSDNFTIATKPLNKITRIGNGKYKHTKTYIYTIIDWRQNRRGPDNLIFGSFNSYNTKVGAQKNLKDLEAGKIEVSYRRDTPLDLIEVFAP